MPSLRSLALDIEPLRQHRDYRNILIGQAINSLGTQVTRVALPYQLYLMTHSALALGALSTIQLAGILSFSLLGGAIADAVDRRLLLFCTSGGLMAVSATLGALAFTGVAQPWHLFILAFIQAVFSAVDGPTRSSMIPRLVSRENLTAAIAINQAAFQTAGVVGPGLGGLLIAAAGLPAAYGTDALSFTAAFVALLSIAPVPPLGTIARPGWTAMVAGLRYVRRVPAILGGFVIDLDAMIFGLPVAIFPVLALDFFHVGAQGLGFLVSAPSAGAIVGVATSGWLPRVRYPGRVLILVVGLWGAAITLFGLTPIFPLALLCLAVAGASDALSAMIRNTINQLSSPDELRGRVSALHSMVVTSGPRLGDIEATSVAAATTAQISVVSGGILCLIGLIAVVRLFPQLATYDVQAPEPTAEPQRLSAASVSM
jgi:MFS family permease